MIKISQWPQLVHPDRLLIPVKQSKSKRRVGKGRWTLSVSNYTNCSTIPLPWKRGTPTLPGFLFLTRSSISNNNKVHQNTPKDTMKRSRWIKRLQHIITNIWREPDIGLSVSGSEWFFQERGTFSRKSKWKPVSRFLVVPKFRIRKLFCFLLFSLIYYNRVISNIPRSMCTTVFETIRRRYT